MRLEANRTGTLGVDPMWHVVDLDDGGLTYTLCRDVVQVHFKRGQRQVAAPISSRCTKLIAAINSAVVAASSR
jgi:hypothetical protein